MDLDRGPVGRVPCVLREVLVLGPLVVNFHVPYVSLRSTSKGQANKWRDGTQGYQFWKNVFGTTSPVRVWQILSFQPRKSILKPREGLDWSTETVNHELW